MDGATQRIDQVFAHGTLILIDVCLSRERRIEMSTRDIIRSFIASELIADAGGTHLSDTDLLLETGIVDSFGIMSLLGFLEEKFSVQVSADDLVPENFESIASISALIVQKCGYQPEA